MPVPFVFTLRGRSAAARHRSAVGHQPVHGHVVGRVRQGRQDLPFPRDADPDSAGACQQPVIVPSSASKPVALRIEGHPRYQPQHGVIAALEPRHRGQVWTGFANAECAGADIRGDGHHRHHLVALPRPAEARQPDRQTGIEASAHQRRQIHLTRRRHVAGHHPRGAVARQRDKARHHRGRVVPAEASALTAHGQHVLAYLLFA
jgi:hypothetical protein